MPDVIIKIGGREFDVACQEGEEHFLKSAAAMLDVEASVLVGQIAHLTESRLLLMSGLMLADKTAGLDDKLKIAEKQIADLQAEMSALKSADPVKVEVPVIPASVTDSLAEIAARAEAMAKSVEEKAAG
ncbi:cell division protein ZapA [Aliiroseovarius lamellibrachiae]|uniref:cell division protein ZapA n=1 Tax=Aliiroseovarius lamellibrachiae TaxID=1924933 RepID=UPI001BE0BE88|nr:cell division protein ZapA [Aliiroseovarius lamellibrachiae]MBT2130768.1 cell division protein ZapA [Aliiroseovarius lamellibrachiae]